MDIKYILLVITKKMDNLKTLIILYYYLNQFKKIKFNVE